MHDTAHKYLYFDWVESEAALIETDGCSKVSGAYRRCCLVHDLSYYYAKAPTVAYKLYLQGIDNYWQQAASIDQAEADADLRRCMQSQSKLGFWSPLAVIRWSVLKMVGKKAWQGHRDREQGNASE